MAVKYPFLHLYIRWYKYKLIFCIVQNRNININLQTCNRRVAFVNYHKVKCCKRSLICVALFIRIFHVSYWFPVSYTLRVDLLYSIFTFITLFTDMFLKLIENEHLFFLWLSLFYAILFATYYIITISSVIFIHVNYSLLYFMQIYNFNVYISNTDGQKQEIYNCIMYRIAYRAHIWSSIRLRFSIKGCHPGSVDQERILQLRFLAIFPYLLCRTLKNWILTEFKVA